MKKNKYKRRTVKLLSVFIYTLFSSKLYVYTYKILKLKELKFMEDTIKKIYETNNDLIKQYPIIKGTCDILEDDLTILLYGYQLDDRLHNIYENDIFKYARQLDPNYKEVMLSDTTLLTLISCFMTTMWHKEGEHSHFFTENSSEFLNETLNEENLKSINNIKCSTIALDMKKGNLAPIVDEVAGTVWIEAAMAHLIRDPSTKIVKFVDTMLLLNTKPEKPLEYDADKPLTILYGTTSVDSANLDGCTTLNRTILKALVYISKTKAPVKLVGNKYFYDINCHKRYKNEAENTN